LAKKEVTVALSADAGDEIFAGYNKYDYLPRYSKHLLSIPTPLRKMAGVAIENISSESIPYYRNVNDFHRKFDKLKTLLTCPYPNELLKYSCRVFSEKEINKLFSASVSELSTKHTSRELNVESYDNLSYMMAVDYETYMIDDI